MEIKRVNAFRDELLSIFTKASEKEEGETIHLDDLVDAKVGLSLFNQTSALGNVHTVWSSDVGLTKEDHATYASLLADSWEAVSPAKDEAFAALLCRRLRDGDGALHCGQEETILRPRHSRLLRVLADHAFDKLRSGSVSGLGRCIAVQYPLFADVPGPHPRRICGTCHAVFLHGNDVIIMDFQCRRLMLPSTADILRLSMYKALGLRAGLALPQHLRVATLTAQLEYDLPRLRLWMYTPSKEMDEAVQSLDYLSQVVSLLQLHVTEVIT